MHMRTTMFRLPFLIILCFFFFPRASSFSSNETDYRSLLAFKSAIDLDPFGALSSWNEATHLCSWNGIKCSLRHKQRVIAINLRSQGLLGSLSPHIGNLSLLTSIILQNNSLHGPIPQQITLLKRLKYVEFSNNSFVGPIPRNISNCYKLVYLNLLDNKLSGAIPPELASMHRLEALGLGKNRFFKHIPPFLGNITSLTKLSLVYGGFVGDIPSSFTQLHNLKFLQLAENSLTGTVPSGLFNLSGLRYLGAPNNRLRGSIPPTLGLTLPNLEALDLFENEFTGPIPPSFSNASLLEVLQLYGNYFSGPIPRLGRLVHLDSLDLQGNLIEDDVGAFVSSLTNSSRLRFLLFGSNLLTGSLPESVANLSRNIITLRMDDNGFGGKIPSGIRNLESLSEFHASGNFLEGLIPVGIASLYNLRSLFLGSNEFSDELRFSFENLTFLSRLDLNRNDLSGNLPPTLANCSNLLELDLSRNNFHGFIPPAILNLSRMSIVMNLSHNCLEGSIPREVGALTNLAALDLSMNELSGAIPDSLSKCTSLEKLQLNGNLLQGEIPLGLSGLIGLHELDLSMNNLSGPIPDLLGKLQLQRLNLSFNRLHGEVPTTGVFKNGSSISVQGNEGICGGIPELELPPCHLSSESKNKKFSTLAKILIPVLCLVGICLMLSAILFVYKLKSFRREAITVTPFDPSSFLGNRIMRLSYLDLSRATDGFSETKLIGFGKFGSVYRGNLIIKDEDQAMMIAVKVLDLSVRGASRSFVAECNALRNVRHRNLLKILSVCESIDSQGDEFKALVYEFKSNGSLDRWLHQDAAAGRNNLDLMQRLNIAVDVARAVEYLHFGTLSSIVHGDLKPSNILLDEHMTAYVGDFGLAKIIEDDVFSNSFVGIRGTIGYIPPEYGSSFSVSTRGDVYSYGILLLEMFAKKRANDESFEDGTNLRSFVGDKLLLVESVVEIVDPLLLVGGESDDGSRLERVKNCLRDVMSVGMACSNEMPRGRMSMAQVVCELEIILHNFLYV